MELDNYYSYLLTNESGTSTYIGITNNLDKRLLQHNGVLARGAKATKKSTTWKYEKIVGGFDKSTAPRFEWYWKHYKSASGKWYNTKSGIDNKINRLHSLLEESEWSHIVIIK